jgi:hypothetical protein
MSTNSWDYNNQRQIALANLFDKAVSHENIKNEITVALLGKRESFEIDLSEQFVASPGGLNNVDIQVDTEDKAFQEFSSEITNKYDAIDSVSIECADTLKFHLHVPKP